MPTVTYLNLDLMASLDGAAFRAREPYPWVAPSNLLTEHGYTRLVETLPEVEMFAKKFGHVRKYGQQGHDRFSLIYHPQLAVAQPWHDFVAELLGAEYQAFIARMSGARRYRLLLHWHYTPHGCQVSPHCDAKRKIGSHIFYFNTAQDWQEAWGGQTQILDDAGRFNSDSAPAFDDFECRASSRAMGNNSLLFMRKGRSWHGVRPLECPPGALRKVFIVVFEHAGLPQRLINFARGRAAEGFRPGQPPTLHA